MVDVLSHEKMPNMALLVLGAFNCQCPIGLAMNGVSLPRPKPQNVSDSLAIECLALSDYLPIECATCPIESMECVDSSHPDPRHGEWGSEARAHQPLQDNHHDFMSVSFCSSLFLFTTKGSR
jgi:hypothetical protein